MKKILLVSFLLIFSFYLIPLGSISVEALNPLEGKIIALDAGHGGTESGAWNEIDGEMVYEKDVNLAVVYALKQKLEDPSVGAKVVLTRVCNETISSRKSRVDMAMEECENLYGKKCDALVSIHHNGSTDSTHDGTIVIYNEKQDIPLAKALLEALVPLTGNNEGLDHGGYGMTVYGHLVSALTEAYYITNTQEAERYLAGVKTPVCANEDDSDYQVFTGNRINEEADALFQGLVNYFSISLKKPPRK